MPDFKAMVNNNLIRYKDIPKLRATNNSIKFRKWIEKVDENDNGLDIVHKYMDSIENAKGIFEKEPGRFIKTLGVYALSCATGAVLAGPVGAGVGAVAGKLIEPAIDLGITMLDTYVLGGISNGWTPRHYFSKDIPSIINKYK